MPMHISLIGARGGQGTSTTAAALALLATRRDHRVELITDELDTMRGLLGFAEASDDTDAVEAVPGLVLCSTPTGDADLVLCDHTRVQTVQRACEGPTLVVLRGPCYLSLRRTVDLVRSGVDGIVIVREPGRSLTNRDVTEITGLPVVAETLVTPQVARSIDAGVLATTIGRRSEFNALNTYLETLNGPATNASTTARSACHTEHSDCVRINRVFEGTDLPLPQSGSS